MGRSTLISWWRSCRALSRSTSLRYVALCMLICVCHCVIADWISDHVVSCFHIHCFLMNRKPSV